MSAGRVPAVVLVGPTASGKSSLAHAAARQHGGVEIVTIDSMQVYRGMDIGTAKPTTAEQSVVAYHLIDLIEPHETYTVSRFQDDAAVALDAIADRGHVALLVLPEKTTPRPENVIGVLTRDSIAAAVLRDYRS